MWWALQGLRRNTGNSYRESTPSEKRAGARSYPRAGRDAARVGLGMNPGKQPYGDASRRPGHTALRNATPGQRAAFNDPVQREDARTRGVGAIAALSPGSPAGMDWENDPTAAHEAGSLTAALVATLQGAVDVAGGRSKARDALRAAEKRGVGVPEAQAAVDKAEAASMGSSAKARASVLGTTGNRTFTSLHHAGDQAIIRAHQILSGEKTPEQVLPIEAKTAHFYEPLRATLNRPSSTAGSHDILFLISSCPASPGSTSRPLASSSYRWFPVAVGLAVPYCAQVRARSACRRSISVLISATRSAGVPASSSSRRRRQIFLSRSPANR